MKVKDSSSGGDLEVGWLVEVFGKNIRSNPPLPPPREGTIFFLGGYNITVNNKTDNNSSYPG